MYEIHGNLFYLRCKNKCKKKFIFDSSENPGKQTCPNCNGEVRPHMLFFDESYDEENYRFETVK